MALHEEPGHWRARTVLAVLAAMLVATGLLALDVISGGNRNHDNLRNRLALMWLNQNRLDVRVAGLDPARVSITCRNTEEEHATFVYAAGERVGDVPHAYGETDFVVLVDGEPVYTTRHFNTNWWHSHDFVFDVVAQEGGGAPARARMRVVGPDGETAPE